MTPLNPSTYNWTSLLPGIYRRPALSTEALWSAKPKELHEIFATAKLRLVAARTPRVLKPAALRAWRLLRFEVPELGVRAVVQDGEVFLEYKGIDEGEIQEWISRTCFVNEEGEGVYDFEALRRDICSKKDDDEQASVLLNFLTRDGLVENISMVLNTDHQITDGIGTRILLGRFLDLFSWCIGLKSEDVLTWEESDKNLSKPWIGMLDGKQKLEGKDFEEVVEKKRNYLYHEISPETNPSLPFQQTTSIQPADPNISIQKIHFHTYTPQETTTLLYATKTLHKSANITHAVHAALTLVLYNQFAFSELSTFNSSCWLNGRRHLSPEKNHIPLCQSFFPIRFTGLERLSIGREPGRAATKERKRKQMVGACEVAREQYALLREEGERGVLLGSMVSTGEEIGRVLRARGRDEKVEGEVKERKEGGAVPLFLSDGITEGYISRSYPTNGERDGGEVVVVEDVFFGANAGGEVILRIATFRDQLRISVEWKEELFDEHLVRGFLEGVKTFLRSLV